MADKRIQDLTPVTSVGDGDLFVLEQGGEAKSLTGGLYKAYLESAFPPEYATGAVRGDIAQTAQTDAWRAQARDNIGLGFFSVVNGALCITYEEA